MTKILLPLLLAALFATVIIISSVADAALLEKYVADNIDSRPAGRYRFSMICFQYRREYYSDYEDAIGILAGTSDNDEYSADFHIYLPSSGTWEELANNQVSFTPRHSMATQPLYSNLFLSDDAEIFTFGGVVDDSLLGSRVVDNLRKKEMAPEDPYFPVDNSWTEPWLDLFGGLPGPRARAASFFMGDSMYVYGGVTADGTIKGDLWKLSASTSGYLWEVVYQPLDLNGDLNNNDNDYYYYAADATSYTDAYGGASYNGYTDYADVYGSSLFGYAGGSDDSYYSSGSSYYYGSSSSYYGSGSTGGGGSPPSGSGSYPPSGSGCPPGASGCPPTTAERDADALADVEDDEQEEEDHLSFMQDQQRKQNPHRRQQLKQKQQRRPKHDFDHPEDELVFYEKVYEQNHRVMESKRNKRTTNNRDAEAASTTGLQDRDLFRYGHCCATLDLADGAKTPSGLQEMAICFGGTGLTTDSRTLTMYKRNEFFWQSLDVTNADSATDAPKPVRDPACAYNKAKNIFMVFGGYDARTGAPTTDEKIYYINVSDLVTTTTVQWEKTNDVQNYDPVYGSQMCTAPISGKTYMYGGRAIFTSNSSLLELDFSDLDSKNNITIAEPIKALDKLPVERAYHIAAAAGTAFYVGFGRNSAKQFQDVWKYDLLDNKWTQLTQTSFGARWGASAVTFGSSIFIFGGRAALTGTTSYNTLIALETQSALFKTVEDTEATAPSARAFHVSFVASGNVIVGLGMDSNGNYLDDWYAFSPVVQTWKSLTVEGDAISARVGASTVQSYNETHSLVGLGFNQVGFNDWYYITVNGNKLKSTKIVLNDKLEPRITRRNFASVTGRGRHVLVCGGMSTDVIASPPDARCYQLDAQTGALGLTSNYTTPVGVVGAPAVYVKDSVFIFGGQVISDPTVSTVFYKRLVRTRPQPLCNTSSTGGDGKIDDTSCKLCGFGSTGVNCEFTAPGSYTTVSGQTRECPTGTFSPVRGGDSATVCVPCKQDTKGNKTGLDTCYNCTSDEFCPVGTSAAQSKQSPVASLLQAKSTLPAGGLIKEENPGAFETPSLPWFPVGIVAGFAILLTIIVGVIYFINRYAYDTRLNYFLPEEINIKLDKIFITFATNGTEMTLSQFILIFSHLGFDISPTHIQKAFEDQVEDTGKLTLSRDDFKKAIMDMIRVGVMPPFKDSLAAKDGHEPDYCCASVGGIRISAFDSFRAEHIPPTLGEPRRVIQTKYGGVLSLLMFVAIIILILAILVNFLYSNVSETKAIVPYPVVQSSFGESLGEVESDFVVRVGINGPIRSSTRYNANDDDTTKARKICLDVDTGSCNNQTRVTPSGFIIPFAENARFDCSFDESTRQCYIDWYCTNCTVIASANLLYTFSSEQSANRVDCIITTSTGIHLPAQEWTGELKIAAGDMQYSTIHEAAFPETDGEIFSGFPATNFLFGLSPTYFESVELVHLVVPSDVLTLDTGYHLRPNGNPVRGNAIKPEAFGTFYDAPVRVNLTTDAEIMYVRRTFIQSLVDLVSSLLGAIAGLAGGFLSFVNFIDESEDTSYTIEEYEGKELKMKKDVDQNGNDNEPTKIIGGDGEDGEEELEKSQFTLTKRKNDSDDSDDEEEKPAVKKLMKLPLQEDGDYDLKLDHVMDADDHAADRCLTLVTLGTPIDLALMYKDVMKATAIPPRADKPYDLEEVRQRIKERAPVDLDGVTEIEVDMEEIERDLEKSAGLVVRSNKKKASNDDNDDGDVEMKDRSKKYAVTEVSGSDDEEGNYNNKENGSKPSDEEDQQQKNEPTA